ncbi:4'-phosphopantetheinyl transferase superfamily protein [Marinithermus hydrothermalis]|uniref:Holo-[acyl-carrier-protein] synthase n=1 Tax=Marinithermus hydrothermalis (strain DSM 14884 / JCM 11576 / T1) TaxID=869210 RepID=F2NKF3_MARHT|nr:4'-phosphopantetheinyl transferase superfamily protein [Marinithermus hydrothermalis]AEB12402.1 Holo-(acyl-carrier-protein) synthase [Marinithermus hydrothermalis DSM 14884]
MPILAVGTDLVSIPRIRGVYTRHPVRFLERHFTAVERAYCLSKPDPAPSLAARFAAKEAFQKCWPEPHGWREVWVEMEGRRPVLRFAPRIQARMREAGWVAHLSLAHEREHALAVVVIEQVDAREKT